MEFLSYIVKICGECNLKCDYCYYFSNGEYKQLTILDENLIEKLIREASQLYDFVEFIWHGGEPLLSGIETFQKIVYLQNQISSQYGVNYRNLIQTNGTLFSVEWVNFLAKHDFGVGISVDGPEWVHDKHRTYENHLGSYSDVMKGINLLSEKGVRKGVLAVITKDSLGFEEKIFNNFLENKIFSFDFLPFFDGNFPFTLRKGDYSDFICKIFDIWLSNDDPSVKIRYIDNIMAGLLGGRQTLCKFTKSCHTYITLDFNGDVYPCDQFMGLKEYKFGNLINDSLEDILINKKRQDFIQRISDLHNSCSNCNNWDVCGGACSYYRMVDDEEKQSRYCYENGKVISHIKKQLLFEHPRIKQLFQPARQ